MGERDDPLSLDPETMRDLGYRAVDAVVDLLNDPSAPPVRRATAAEMAERVPPDAPEGPSPFDELLGRLSTDVLPYGSRHGHPGFFAFIPGGGTFPGALGDFLASSLNVFTGTWLGSAGGSHLEQVVLGWFKEWIGYPATAGGILLSGGSAANMTALACAREALLGAMTDTAVAYVSDQAHSSLARAARTLGFRADQVRVLPTDRGFRMRPDISPRRSTRTSGPAASRCSSARPPALPRSARSTRCLTLRGVSGLEATLGRGSDLALRFGVAHALTEEIGIATEVVGRRESNRVDPLLDYGLASGRKSSDPMSERSDEIAEAVSRQCSVDPAATEQSGGDQDRPRAKQERGLGRR